MPKPHPGEPKNTYISRCISQLVGEEGRPQEQATAICYSYWEQHTAEKSDRTTHIKPGTAVDRVGVGKMSRPDQAVPGRYPSLDHIELPDNLKPGRDPYSITVPSPAERLKAGI